IPIVATLPVVPPAYWPEVDTVPPTPVPALITVGVPAMPPVEPIPVATPDTATVPIPTTVTRSLLLIVPSPVVSNGLWVKRPPVMLSSTMRKLWPPEEQVAVDGTSVV